MRFEQHEPTNQPTNKKNERNENKRMTTAIATHFLDGCGDAVSIVLKLLVIFLVD